MEEKLRFEVGLCFNCDFCGKPSLIASDSGIIYCKNCFYSYGEFIK